MVTTLILKHFNFLAHYYFFLVDHSVSIPFKSGKKITAGSPLDVAHGLQGELGTDANVAQVPDFFQRTGGFW